MTHKITRRRFVATTATVAAGSFFIPTLVRAAKDEWADLTGRFVYDGTPPERKKLKVDKDVDCCGKFDIRDESLMVGKDGGLANVFLYSRSRKVDICPELEENYPEELLLDNIDCIFKPHCMAIWADKQKFKIINSDPVAQNVAFSPLGDAPANIVLPVKGDATWTFKRKQNTPVPIACNYHPWENAYILPREDPYFTISATDGTFTISKLPVGEKLEFQVWHERVGYLDTADWKKGRFKMKLKPGKNDLGTITLPAAMFDKTDKK